MMLPFVAASTVGVALLGSAATLPPGVASVRWTPSLQLVQIFDDNLFYSPDPLQLELCREHAAGLARRDGRPDGRTYALAENPRLCFAFVARNPDLYANWAKAREVAARRFYCRLLGENSPSWESRKQELGPPPW